MLIKFKIKCIKFFLFLLIITIFVFLLTEKIEEPTNFLVFQDANEKQIKVIAAPPTAIKNIAPIIQDKKTEIVINKKVLSQNNHIKQDSYIENVPFLIQAPFSEWKDPRQQDACEEAASLMAISWATDITKISKFEAKEKILDIVKYQIENIGEYRDTSATDTLKYIINGYFNYQKTRLEKNITLENIIKELASGNLIIVPVNGQKLSNPYFTQPGPERHMIVLRGYDTTKKEFIANDPGVGRGEKYRYPQKILWVAIRDYETGYHIPIIEIKKIIIVIEK